jgi:type I restriction enzyme S subunit
MGGRYQEYAENRDSEVGWVGKIPSHWEIKRLKYICKVGTGDKDTVNAVVDGAYPFFVRSQNIERINSYTADCEAVLTAGDGVGVGKVYHYFNGKFDYHQRVYMLSAFETVYGKYVFYYLSSNFYKVALEGGAKSTVDSLRLPLFLNFEITVPPLYEQQIILDFLDLETTKIDTLIDKQQQLIKLLKEKRQAVISHAVTKGLNPDVPMKDSGVEWLGEVPAHWGRVPLKHLSKIKYGIGEPPKYVDDGIPLVRATNIRSGRITDVNLVYVNPDDIPANRIVWLEAGDIIVVRSGAGTGDSSIIPKEYEGSVAGFDMVVKPIDCDPSFLGHALLSNYVRNNQIDLEKTRAAQPHLNAEELGECFVLLPSDQEQIDICLYIERKLAKFDCIIDQAEGAVKLLHERRTALISAAVTGKIDVRNWQPAQTETPMEASA